MIYSVMKNLGSGDIDISNSSSVSKSFTYDYLVITDHMDTPLYIYAHARLHDLPISGSVSLTGVRLKSISISRWDLNNAKAVPSYNLPKKANGSYAIWKYEVTYANDALKELDDLLFFGYALNFNASIKLYQLTTYMCYFCRQNKVPVFALYTSKSKFIVNLLNQPVSYLHVVKNITISFDFKVSKISVDDWVSKYIPLYVGSVNSQDETVAGINLKKGCAKIITLSISRNDLLYATVHALVEIAVQKPVALLILPNVALSAIPEGLKIPYRVHKWSGSKDTLPSEKAKGVFWFDRDMGLGHFTKLSGYIMGTNFEIYDQKVILNALGGYYKYLGDTPPDLNDPNIGKTYIVTAPVKSWKSLNIPSKLK